jgi:hypothetical protein
MAGHPPPKQSNTGGCVVVGIIVALLLVVGRCSSSGGSNSSPAVQEVGNAQHALATAVSEQAPTPPEPLSASAVKRGASRVVLTTPEGLAGEMIYSQNCYDAVGHAFTWRKLDECGGFDIEASLALGDHEPANAATELAWFNGEAVAGRYLKSAVAAGQNADAADQRLAALQAQVGARHRPKPVPKPVAGEAAGMDQAVGVADGDTDSSDDTDIGVNSGE